MNKLIIDAAKDKVFFMIIGNDINYNIAYENSKKFTLPEGMNRFREMFREIYES